MKPPAPVTTTRSSFSITNPLKCLEKLTDYIDFSVVCERFIIRLGVTVPKQGDRPMGCQHGVTSHAKGSALFALGCGQDRLETLADAADVECTLGIGPAVGTQRRAARGA